MSAGDIPALILAEAKAQGVDPAQALGIWRAEGSISDSRASPKGALGPMQLMPPTAAELGVDPNDLAQNIRGGISYIKRLNGQFQDPKLVAAAYNAGPGAVHAHGGVPPYPETQGYVARATAAPVQSGADIFGLSDQDLGPASAGDAPGGAAAGGAAPASGADIFGLSDKDVAQSGGTDSKEPPAAPPPARKNPIVVVNSETNAPYNDAQQGAYAQMLKAGELDSGAPIGSSAFPRGLASADDTPAPGEWYVDLQGVKRQAPGAPSHSPGAEISRDWYGAWSKFRTDNDAARAFDAKTQAAPWDVSALPERMAHYTARPFQYLGDLGSALMSPVQGLTDGALVYPAARAMSALPTYRTGLLPRWGAPQRISGEEALNQNAGAVRTALGAVGEAEPLGAFAGVEGPSLGAEIRAGGNYFGQISRKAAMQSPFTPEQLRAAHYVAGRMPTGIDAAALDAADPRLMAAEAMGQGGQRAAGALSRMPGQTGDMLGGRIVERQAGRGDQILQSMADATGVDPASARGLVDRMVARGRSDAAPLYKDAFDDRPMWSPALEQIAAKPSVKAAMKDARWMMGEEGVDPETLGMDFAENPEQWASHTPPPFSAAEPADRPVGFAPQRASGPARAPTQGRSLLKFIADNGGIADSGGDVAAMGGDQWHLGRAYQRKLIGDLPPDDVAMRAWEAGYFPPDGEPPSVNELLDAMGEEMRGRALYARPADQASLDRFHRANADEELAARGGHPDDLPTPDQYSGRPAPTDEPVRQMVPNTQFWDYVKRALDDELTPYLSGKLEWTDKARLMNDTRASLVEEIKRLNPKYEIAVDTSGDYLGARQAFRDAHRMILDGRTDATDFAARMQGMTPAERRYFRAGIANKAYEQVVNASGQPTRLMNAFRTRLAQSKLRMALGSKRAAQLADEIDLHARMKGFEDRYGPRANSVTPEMIAEMADTDQMSPAHRIGATYVRNVARTGGPLKAGVATVGEELHRLVKTLPSRGKNTTVRDEAGAMLTGSPQEFAQILRKLEDVLPRPSGSLRRRTVRGMIGASTISAPERNRKPAPTQKVVRGAE